MGFGLLNNSIQQLISTTRCHFSQHWFQMHMQTNCHVEHQVMVQKLRLSNPIQKVLSSFYIIFLKKNLTVMKTLQVSVKTCLENNKELLNPIFPQGKRKLEV